jgi:hypothetical protein
MNNSDKEKQELVACQITVQPVENGFVIQAVNVDGNQSERRLIATDIEDVRKRVHEIADVIYTAGKRFEMPTRSSTTYSPKE